MELDICNSILSSQSWLWLAFHIVLWMRGNELDPGEFAPDRLLQLLGPIEIDLARLRMPKLVELLRIDIAGVHHRQELQRLAIHERHERRIGAQQIEIGGRLLE